MTYIYSPLRVIYGVRGMAVRFPAQIYVFNRRAVCHARMQQLRREA